MSRLSWNKRVKDVILCSLEKNGVVYTICTRQMKWVWVVGRAVQIGPCLVFGYSWSDKLVLSSDELVLSS